MTFQYHSNSKIIQLGLFLTLTSALILSCHKKTDIPDPNAELNLKKAPAIDSDSLKSLEMEDSAKDSSATDPMVHADSGAAHWKLHFTSRPQVLAYPNHPFQYRPVLASKPLKEGEGNNPDGHLGRTSDKGANSIKIIQGPDSMKIQNGQVLWMPKVLGNFPVTIEAMGENNKAQQSFVIKVTKIIDLVLKPLPTQINKGDSVLFDLSTSIYPTWALPDTKVRYDFDGDGKWDTDPLPLSENLKIHHAYGVAGKFTAIIETHFKNLESAKVEANISVIGAVNAAVKIWPDTVEPGANLNIDASASKGDGQLRYSIDWNNDGKADWSDSLAGKGIAKAPGSGKYIGFYFC